MMNAVHMVAVVVDTEGCSQFASAAAAVADRIAAPVAAQAAWHHSDNAQESDCCRAIRHPHVAVAVAAVAVASSANSEGSMQHRHRYQQQTLIRQTAE